MNLRVRIGQLLCWLGLHRWTHASAVDKTETEAGIEYVVTDYSWCVRPHCDQPTHKTNIERRTLIPHQCP